MRHHVHSVLMTMAAAFALVASSCVLPGEHAAMAPSAPDDDTGFIRVRDAWIRVKDTGTSSEKAPVVFVHGYGSRLEAWRDIVPHLANERRVISFDMRGFGKSEKTRGEYGPKAHAEDLVALLHDLGVSKPVLVGHSYGGGVILHAALLLGDDVSGIGLISAYAFDEELPPSFRLAKFPVLGEVLFGAFYKEVPGEKYLLAFHDEERFVTVEALDEMKALMAEPGAVYAAMETVRGMDYLDTQARYRDVKVPTVVIWGENDRVVPLRVGKRLAATLDDDLVVLSGSGHMPMWERPESVVRALRPILDAADLEIAQVHETKNDATIDESSNRSPVGAADAGVKTKRSVEPRSGPDTDDADGDNDDDDDVRNTDDDDGDRNIDDDDDGPADDGKRRGRERDPRDANIDHGETP